eukprot:3777499-Heterocapsa_arctica.AAC.1
MMWPEGWMAVSFWEACSVLHTELSDRLVFDRRPQNGGEARCPWAGLPLGPMLARLRLRSHEGFRGSGDDL